MKFITTGASGNTYSTSVEADPARKRLTRRSFSSGPIILRIVLWAFLAALIIGAVLTVIAPRPALQTGTAITPTNENAKENDSSRKGTNTLNQPGGITEGARVPVRIDPSSLNPATLLALIAMLGLALPIGLWMMLAKSGSLRRRVGGGLLAGLSVLGAKEVSGTLLKELKIDVKTGNPTLNVKPDHHETQPATERFSVGAELLGEIGPFPVGKATLSDEQTKTDLTKLAQQLDSSPVRDQAVLVMLIGSADRQRLRGGLQSRFDSNVGLAQARAEWVRKELTARFPEATKKLRFLLLTSGPKRTEDAISSDDLKLDRAVEVWALWGGPLDPTTSQAN